MKALKLITIALATTLTLGVANADEANEMEVMVVTAARPDKIEAPAIIAIETTALVDFTELALEAPSLNPKEFKLAPERMDLALRDEVKPQS